eukprot:COSAG01_NODE_4186_length_5260_cov_5.388684_1_plen_98_part_00
MTADAMYGRIFLPQFLIQQISSCVSEFSPPVRRVSDLMLPDWILKTTPLSLSASSSAARMSKFFHLYRVDTAYGTDGDGAVPQLVLGLGNQQVNLLE